MRREWRSVARKRGAGRAFGGGVGAGPAAFSAGQARGEVYWRPIIAERRRIRDALAKWSPLPALGVPPKSITEPLTIMLWGITSDSVRQWLGGARIPDHDFREPIQRSALATKGLTYMPTGATVAALTT